MADAAILVRRAEMMRAIRRRFDSMGFIEVETPVRIAAPAPECHIDCPPVSTGGFLRASPELQMKKLLASGLERIYQIGPCFRDGERGSRHRPEFTMMEWYRRGASYLDIMDDTESLVRSLFAGFRPGDAFSCVKIKVRDAYMRFAGWDPWANPDEDRFDYDMAVKIEPALAKEPGGVFLIDYPVWAASLSRTRGDVAERWEFYWKGMELANAFGELCNSAEQRERFDAAKAKRAELGEADYPVDGEFIDAIARIGSAAGVALGLDRLAMVLFGETDISRVIAF